MDVLIEGRGLPCIVALHGIQGTRGSWSRVVEAFGGDARFVLPNLRGRAAARRGAVVADHSLAAYAADATDAIVEHAGRPFFLAGWSMGVSVALEYLRIGLGPRPDGLILLSGSPCLAETRWFRGRGDALLADIVAREARLGLLDAADRDAVAMTWTAIAGTDQRSLLPSIDIPTLVIHGSDDEDSPWAHAGWLVDGLPSARLVTLAGIGHSVLTQAPARVADEMRDFIATTTRPQEIA